MLPLLSPKATSIQHEMEAFISFVVREEDPSFLVMARVVVIILPVVRYVATFDIRLLIVLIAIQRLLTLQTLLNPSFTSL